jgi:hypothetical protein
LLPGKRYVGQLSSDFILERRRQLQEYLDELLAHVTFAHSPPVLHFLQVSFFIFSHPASSSALCTRAPEDSRSLSPM